MVKVRGNRGTIKPRLEAVIKALDLLRHDLPFGDHRVVGNMEEERDKTTSVTDCDSLRRASALGWTWWTVSELIL